MKEKICICWLRRDLRLTDHAALYHALKSGVPVLPLFIFDTLILDKLNDPKDSRVTFIYEVLKEMESKLNSIGATLLVKHGTPQEIWEALFEIYDIQSVYINHDYEPYASTRDGNLSAELKKRNIPFHTYKDQVIFEKDEVMKDDGSPYTVFTPYFRKWQKKLNSFYISPYPVEKHINNLYKHTAFPFPSLESLNFSYATQTIPSIAFESKIHDYEERRDFPAADATTRIGKSLLSS